MLQMNMNSKTLRWHLVKNILHSSWRIKSFLDGIETMLNYELSVEFC